MIEPDEPPVSAAPERLQHDSPADRRMERPQRPLFERHDRPILYDEAIGRFGRDQVEPFGVVP